MNEARPINASVKVMRSYDYCHFEVSLSCDALTTMEEVDALRKQAAKLADKAVRQYKVRKEFEQEKERDDYAMRRFQARCDEIREKPEDQLTPDEKAMLRAESDHKHWLRKEYEYESDDWDDSDSPYEDSDY